MSYKLKSLLLEKLGPKIGTNLAGSLTTKTKLEEGYFYLDLKLRNETTISQNSSVEQVTSGIKLQYLSHNNLRCNIERKLFIKSVVECILENPKLDNVPKRIVMDYSSPNIAKPFHFGHLRSTIIGNFIGNLKKHLNSKVTRINYLGDWGTQFGLLNYGLESKNINIEQLKENPIKILYEAYVHANKAAAEDPNVLNKARTYFANIEQGIESTANWKKMRNVTIDELTTIYNRLGIQFDEYHWESDYNGAAIKDLITTLEKQGILQTDSKGRKVAKINSTEIPVMKSDNTTLYLSRDIAALLDRYNRYKFDEMLYIVDDSQSQHFDNLINIVKTFKEDCAKGCKHIRFGRIKGMSTRSGNIVFLNDILDEAKDKMIKLQKLSKNTRQSAMNDETCDILGTTAVIINDLKRSRTKSYDFNWNNVLQSDGDSGIKLQYLHCRLHSLEKNSGHSLPSLCQPDLLKEPIIEEVISVLAEYEEVLQTADADFEAYIIVSYLFKLASRVNSMFTQLKVKGTEKELGEQRLLLFHCARLVLKRCLEILGVKPLDEM